MPRYVIRNRPTDRAEFSLWKELGFTGDWEAFRQAKASCEGGELGVTGDLGQHCADCADVSLFLCDYPVGDGRTCDRPMCEAHAAEIAPDIHYCAGHHGMWREFRDKGGVDKALRNVIAFKHEK